MFVFRCIYTPGDPHSQTTLGPFASANSLLKLDKENSKLQLRAKRIITAGHDAGAQPEKDGRIHAESRWTGIGGRGCGFSKRQQ